MLTGPTNKQKDNTVNLRQTFLRAQAQTMASSGRLSEAAAIKSLEHHEAMKRAHQQLRNLMSRSNQGSGGLAMIKVPAKPPSATPIEAQEPLDHHHQSNTESSWTAKRLSRHSWSITQNTTVKRRKLPSDMHLCTISLALMAPPTSANRSWTATKTQRLTSTLHHKNSD